MDRNGHRQEGPRRGQGRARKADPGQGGPSPVDGPRAPGPEIASPAGRGASLGRNLSDTPSLKPPASCCRPPGPPFAIAKSKPLALLLALVPVPVHPDDPLARCKFCPSVFLSRNGADKAFIERHEAACEENPERIFRDSARNWQGLNTTSYGTVTQTVSVTSSAPSIDAGQPWWPQDDWSPTF